MNYTFSLYDAEDEKRRREILGPLMAYNHNAAGDSKFTPLDISIEKAQGETIGGLCGRTAFDWLYIELVFVPEILRRQGIGTKLIELSEQEALKRKCHSAWLDTFEFQAKAFYEKLAYQVFGELPNYPYGFSRFFLKKSLGRLQKDVDISE